MPHFREVTGVCSTKNLELVRAIGADQVIDYTQEDFRDGADRYDVGVRGGLRRLGSGVAGPNRTSLIHQP
jgi:NADPH:quinone reductase-like Zn-dependent oxidoreductase